MSNEKEKIKSISDERTHGIEPKKLKRER